MASDPEKPLLRLIPGPERVRPRGSQRAIPRLESFSRQRQIDRFSPQFNRIAEILNRDPSGLEMRADPAGLAPERLLVFELRGSIRTFADAVRRVPGLELVDEEELEQDDSDKAPVAYLMVPDVRALRDLEGLWRRWQRGELRHGETAWRDVFALLRDLRIWGPQDRVETSDAHILGEEIEGKLSDELIRLEVELVYRADTEIGRRGEEEVRESIHAQDGQIVSSSRIDEIAYHALLADLPVVAVRQIIRGTADSIGGLDPIRNIRPQSIASAIEVSDSEVGSEPPPHPALGEPILGLLDGVPLAAHRALTDHLVVDDRFDLEPTVPVAERVHGTAMASLIVHGDRNQPEAALPRRIHSVPVLSSGDKFSGNQLIVDVIYSAVLGMREGPKPTAPSVVIVNLSLANARRSFHGQMSAWARLLDRLAYRLGILFVVSAGNCLDTFSIPAFADRTSFEDAASETRAAETLRALGLIVRERRLFSPAETVNGITVGAWNHDAVTANDRETARVNVDPYSPYWMSNPSSALGPGFALSVKPDILMPGAREHLRVVRNDVHIEVKAAGPARFAGLRVAAPPRDGRENLDGYTNGTSGAAALASRTAHRIHDALEQAYREDFLSLPAIQRAVLLKALLVHTAKWPEGTADLIRSIIGPSNAKQHVRQRDNIRRFLGFGIVAPEDAVACAADRATFWATGLLRADSTSVISVPIPNVISGRAHPHSMSATLAWFTPTAPGRRSYRTVRLKLLEPAGLDALGVEAEGNQPDKNQTNRGTVYTRCWSGSSAANVMGDSDVELTVQRDPDQGATVDEAIPFGFAATLSMPGVIEIYEQVRQRIAQRIYAEA